MSERSKMTAEDLARKLMEAHWQERTGVAADLSPEEWVSLARAAADALGQELAPGEPELERCPVCGGRNMSFVGDAVWCDDSGCCVSGPVGDPTGERWNRMCRRLRGSTYHPPRELEYSHPRPWTVDDSCGYIRDKNSRIVRLGFLSLPKQDILDSGSKSERRRALVAAYNAAGEAEE